MRHSALFVLVAALVCGGATGLSLDQQFIEMSTASCIEDGRLGATPARVAENCRCASEQAADYSSAPLKQFFVEHGRMPDSSRDGMFVDMEAYKSALLLECPEAYKIFSEAGSLTGARNRFYGSP